jgi:hypothetical protein
MFERQGHYRNFSHALSGLAVCIAGVISASGSAASQEPPAGPASGKVTVTGCVQRIDESGSLDTTIPERTPTPEQAGVRANLGEPGSGFMLTDATPPPGSKGEGRGERTTGPRVRYVLIGDENELAKYQGQRVRAQGTLPAAPTKPAETAPVGTSGSREFQSNTARLKVTSIERVAGDCK